jgi:hypothetical protein
MISEDFKLMTVLEGNKSIAYDCPAGFRSVGVGFNMEQVGARKVWDKLQIKEDFDKVFNKEQSLSDESSQMLFDKVWKWCDKVAKKRCNDLGVSYEALPQYHKFIVQDIAYNTGSVKDWRKVFLNKTPESVLYEARRNPKELMDNRVSKIGFYFGIIKNIDDAKKVGLEFAKYLT